MSDNAPIANTWSSELLDSMRMITDAETDALSADVFESGGPPALLRMTRALEDWETPIPQDLPEKVREFFARPVKYPDWVDYSKIAIAEDLFVCYGPVSVVVLLLNAVTHFFTNPAGARSFYLAKIFSPDSLRNRMLEVPQFVIDITEKGGLRQTENDLPPYGVAKGRGLVTVQKLRVIHSNIRLLLKLDQKNPEDNWDVASLGEPINQQDLAEAVMCFCLCTIEGLRKVGIDQTPAAEEATLNSWKTVGFLLGMREELQPVDVPNAFLLRDTIYNRTAKATTEGAALIAEMLHIMKELLPWIFRQLPAGLMRYQLGEQVADLLKVPNPRLLVWLFTVLKPVWEEKKAFARTAKVISPVLVKWLTSAERTGHVSGLRLPEVLAEKWGITR